MKRMSGAPLRERFWNRVDRSGDCWLWVTGTGHSKTYGWLWVRTKNVRAHRVAWTLSHGKIPAGMCVCHHCDNPSCVNPDHLFLGTTGDNNTDKTVKGRVPHGEKHCFAKLTNEQVRTILSSPAVGLKKFADRFGVDPKTIHAVRQRRTWKHIHPHPKG